MAENTGNTAFGAPVTATDPDAGDTLTYSITGSNPGGFTVHSTTGQLRSGAASSYDFEEPTKSSYTVTVTATDGQGGSASIEVTVAVTDVNEPPGQPVVSISDQTRTSLTVRWTAPDNAGRPAIEDYDVEYRRAEDLDWTEHPHDGTGLTALIGSLIPDREYLVQVRAGNDEGRGEWSEPAQSATLANRGPTFPRRDDDDDDDENPATRSLPENSPVGTFVGAAVVATDPDAGDTLTYSITGPNPGGFTIDSTTGQLRSGPAERYDFEDPTKSSYTVTVTAADGQGGSASIEVTVTVTDVNEAPAFAESDPTRQLAENTGNTALGALLSASDPDAGDTLTYSITGPNPGGFTIDSTTAQLRSGPAESYDFEDPTKSSYMVTVTATDPHGVGASIAVTVTVSDLNEPPGQPVVSITDQTRTSLTVEWTAPDNAGRPAITDYDIEYRQTSDTDWTDHPHQGTGLTTVIGSLTPGADYQVRVRARNHEGQSPWSNPAQGTTVTNSPPDFGTITAGRSVPENSPQGTNVGAAVTATDPDADTDDTLTYRITGPNPGGFTIHSTTGQLSSGPAENYDFENPNKDSYAVTVTATDPHGGSASTDVTVTVIDVNEAPGPPAVSISGQTRTSLVVEWDAPDNAGRPAITDYDVEYRRTSETDWTNHTHAGTGLSAVIGPLSPGTEYQVRVLARNHEGDSPWSDPAQGTTVTNSPPEFGANTASRSVAENSVQGTNVGAAVTATDPDEGDTLTYSLGGADAGSFEIDNGGQITVGAGTVLDHETGQSYAVTVTAADPHGGSASIDVTITVIDVNEPPVFTEGNPTRQLEENTGDAPLGGPVSATDPDTGDTLTYRITGSNLGGFTIDAHSGQLSSGPAESYDFENQSSYAVTVTATDPHNVGASVDVTITVTDVNEAGTVVVSGAVQTGQVLTAVLSDPDQPVTSVVWQWSRSATQGGVYTDIDDATSAVYTVTDTDANMVLRVTASYTDKHSAGQTAQAFTSAATSAPMFPSDAVVRVVEENLGSGNVGAAITATDADMDSLTYTVAATPGGAAHLAAFNRDFELDSASGQITVKEGAAIDYETRSSYQVLYQVTDGEDPSGNTDPSGTVDDTLTLTITVTNVNDAPVFAESNPTRQLEENTGDAPLGGPVSATDPDEGDTLTYRITGSNPGGFTIDSTSGQLLSGPASNYDFENSAKNSYAVTVTATDPHGGSASIEVTITVTDMAEPPGPPAVSIAGQTRTSLVVEWTAPDNAGRPAVTDYDVEYRRASDTDWTDHTHDGPGLSAVIGPLSPGTDYEVRVLARNHEGDGLWSDLAEGTTVTNSAPIVADDEITTTRSLPENSVQGTSVGGPVSATDPDDGDTLTYRITGPNPSGFTIDSTSGQLRSGPAENYDFENPTKKSYAVTVTATDPHEGSASIAVTITVTDMAEPPDSPVVSIAGQTRTSLTVGWTAPDNAGRPAITDYDVEYRRTVDADWTNHTHDGPGLSAVIGPLSPGTEYQVRVLARNHEGDSPWSNPAQGTTVTNSPPEFGANTASRSVPENSQQGTNVGAPVTATDTDDTLTYSLGGADSGSFEIDSGGQITVGEGTVLDHETGQSYTVTVTAADPHEASASIAVTVTVTDMAEPPGRPTVSIAGQTRTSLVVGWTAPDNAGRPAITDYDVEYREVTDPLSSWNSDAEHEGTGLSITLTDLTPGTDYEARVLARNHEGDSPWSNPAQGTTVASESQDPEDDSTGCEIGAFPTGVSTVTDAWFEPDPSTMTVGVWTEYTLTVAGGGCVNVLFGGRGPNTGRLLVDAWFSSVSAEMIEQGFPPRYPPDPETFCRSEEKASFETMTVGMGSKVWMIACHSGTAMLPIYDYNSPDNVEEGPVRTYSITAVDPLPVSGQQDSQAGSIFGLGAYFEGAPPYHDGTAPFTFRIVFSDDIAPHRFHFVYSGGIPTGYADLRPGMWVNGAWPSKYAKRVDGRNDLWEITVLPNSDGAVTVGLNTSGVCIYGTIYCTEDGRPFSHLAKLTVPGPQDVQVVEEEDDEQQQALEAENSPAGGAPAITGTAQVGETLLADPSGIADADGLDDATFTYQWIAGGLDIDGATGSSYTLTEADQGLSIQVRVSFTDNAGNAETLTSAATAAVEAAPELLTAEFLEVPSSHDGESAFTFELRFSEEFPIGYEKLRDHVLEVTGGLVTQARRLDKGSNVRWEITVEPNGDNEVTVALPVTNDCDNQGAVCAEDGKMLSNRTELTVAGPVAEEEEQQDEPQPENSPATGAPSIRGTAQVGERLTADTSGIADADGLSNVSFSYQWLAGGAAIQGATGSRYTLRDSVAGKAVRVRVSFTDDAGNAETLTSAATAAVAEAEAESDPAEPPPAPRNLTATVNDDGSVTLTWEAPDDDSVSGVDDR